MLFPYDEPEQAELAETSKKWIQTSECNKKYLYAVVCQSYRVSLSGGTARISFDRENYILFTNLTEEVEIALQQLQKHIEKYPQIEQMAKSSVELIDDSNEYCSKLDEAALDVKVSNRGKRTISCLERYWDNVFGTLAIEKSYGTLPNEYFLPEHFQEIKENKLGTVTLWANLCIGNLQIFNSNYKYETAKGAQRAIFTYNLTTG